MKRTSALIMILVVGLFFMASSQPENGDVNCDGGINIMDVVHTINYLYKDGPQLCAFVSSGLVYKEYSQSTPVIPPPPESWWTGWPTVDYLSISAPDSGYIVFKVWAILFADKEEVRMGLTTNENSDPSMVDYCSFRQSLSTHVYEREMTVEKFVQIDSASTITVYFKATGYLGDFSIRKYKLSAIYYPIKY